MFHVNTKRAFPGCACECNKSQLKICLATMMPERDIRLKFHNGTNCSYSSGHKRYSNWCCSLFQKQLLFFSDVYFFVTVLFDLVIILIKLSSVFLPSRLLLIQIRL